jgi:hypothetical protein
MLPAIKLAFHELRAASPSQEFPAVTFNRLCYSYLNNDWIMVISSCFTLATTLFAILVSFNNNLNIKY